MENLFRAVSVKKQGNEAALLRTVREQFKANRYEFDDAKIEEQKEAAIRALHNMSLMEAERYVKEGGSARRLSSYSSIRPSSSEPQLPPPSGPTSTMRGHTAHSGQAQVSCQLGPGCKPAPGPNTRPVPGSSCSASLCSAAGCCLGHLIIEHALRICSYPSLADTSAAVRFLPALAQLQSFTSCFVALAMRKL
ncbi:predicted protein, partial [Haematococcus lacustris]